MGEVPRDGDDATVVVDSTPNAHLAPRIASLAETIGADNSRTIRINTVCNFIEDGLNVEIENAGDINQELLDVAFEALKDFIKKLLEQGAISGPGADARRFGFPIKLERTFDKRGENVKIYFFERYILIVRFGDENGPNDFLDHMTGIVQALDSGKLKNATIIRPVDFGGMQFEGKWFEWDVERVDNIERRV